MGVGGPPGGLGSPPLGPGGVGMLSWRSGRGWVGLQVVWEWSWRPPGYLGEVAHLTHLRPPAGPPYPSQTSGRAS